MRDSKITDESLEADDEACITYYDGNYKGGQLHLTAIPPKEGNNKLVLAIVFTPPEPGALQTKSVVTIHNIGDVTADDIVNYTFEHVRFMLSKRNSNELTH